MSVLPPAVQNDQHFRCNLARLAGKDSRLETRKERAVITRVKQMISWGYFRDILGIFRRFFRDIFWDILGIFWGFSGDILGIFWVYLHTRDKKRESGHHKSQAKLEYPRYGWNIFLNAKFSLIICTFKD